MENHWSCLFFQGIVMIIVIVCEQCKNIYAAYSSRCAERVGAAWKWAALSTAIVVAFVVIACPFIWEAYDGTPLQTEEKRRGFVWTSAFYGFTVLILFAAPLQQLYKAAKKYKNSPRTMGRIWMFLILELFMVAGAFTIIYLTRPEILYGPYL